MAGGYRVDLAQMGTLITTLETAKDRMTSANKALGESSPRDLGSDDIDDAGEDFQHRWKYGIGKIADFSGTVAEGLAKAKDVYAKMEQSVTGALGPSQGSPSAPPPPPPPGQSGIADRLGGGAA
jgi:hypothetical protein